MLKSNTLVARFFRLAVGIIAVFVFTLLYRRNLSLPPESTKPESKKTPGHDGSLTIFGRTRSTVEPSVGGHIPKQTGKKRGLVFIFHLVDPEMILRKFAGNDV